MKAIWNVKDFRAMAQNNLHFSPEQSTGTDKPLRYCASGRGRCRHGARSSPLRVGCRLLHLRHPDVTVDLGQVDEDLVAGDAEV